MALFSSPNINLMQGPKLTLDDKYEADEKKLEKKVSILEITQVILIIYSIIWKY